MEARMYTAFVLVKNIDSDCDELNFSNFKLKEIQQDDDDFFKEARNSLFPGSHADKGDWIYERCYQDTIANLVNTISNDIENILFLLRLFKVGDLVFLAPCIKKPDGTLLRQLPYRVMSDISPSQNYQLQAQECSQFDEFATKISSQKNWESAWFQTARRFFLYGSSKEFNPRHNLIDRIVDYMIVMESILVPEKDFVGRRLRERSISLLNDFNPDQNDPKLLLRDFYEIRSRIVHGDNISSNSNVLHRNVEFENIVRKVIIEAIKTFPEDDSERMDFLKQLFDVCDGDKATQVYQDFCSIKETAEKKRCFDLISKRLQKIGVFTENRKQKTENRP
jgi:hypothetical protein